MTSSKAVLTKRRTISSPEPLLRSDKTANKIEIKKAVEETLGEVESGTR
jgi:ribosomal protein L23